MASDSKLILPLLQVEENDLNEATGNVYNRKNTSNKTTTFNNILRLLSQLPKEKLQALVARYSLDMQLFGYKFNTTSLEASCEIRRSDGTFCC